MKKAKTCAPKKLPIKKPEPPVSKPVEVAKKPVEQPVKQPVAPPAPPVLTRAPPAPPIPQASPPPPPIEVIKSIPPPDIKPLKFKDYPREIEKKASQEDEIRAGINSKVGPDIEHHLVGPKLVPTQKFLDAKKKQAENNTKQPNTKTVQVAKSEDSGNKMTDKTEKVNQKEAVPKDEPTSNQFK